MAHVILTVSRFEITITRVPSGHLLSGSAPDAGTLEAAPVTTISNILVNQVGNAPWRAHSDPVRERTVQGRSPP
jgi:hypothetical protein